MIINNKRGETFMSWLEIMVFISLILAGLALLSTDMNSKYGQNHDLTGGLVLNNTNTQLAQLSQQMQNSTSSGQTSITDFGILKLTTAPGLILSILGMLISFATGSFIVSVVSLLHLGAFGTMVAISFQLIWIIGLIVLFLRMVLRVQI